MNEQVLSALSWLMQWENISALTKQIGWVDNATTKSALAKALPLLLNGISKNSQTAEWKGSILSALQKHDGSILDNIKWAIESTGGQEWEKIVGHILWNSSTPQLAGLSGDQSKKLLSTLAPLVMGALGKANNWGSLDTSNLMGIAESFASSQMGKMFDQDGDGDFDKQDVITGGINFLKDKLFWGK